MFRAEDDKVQQCLRKGGREDLVNTYEEKLEKGEENIMIDIIDAGMEIEESVILHFDCHNNNFLFDYKEDDRENPLNVSIFDWQMSGLQSPVLDLSYFLYCTASREDLSRLDELLKFYHGHLTSFLKDLGSNVEKLFPYSTLVEHWKKYNTYAFIMAKSFVGLCLASEEDSPDFGDLKGIADVLAEFAKKYENLYTERLITLVDHYCSFILN
ncbi:hypothetical protein JTB14_037587 [Gonioctena quinquepunctata]|nr:hypothetical protein JTB14_037587 [Gonioctena quinquepunctata]